MVLLLLGLLLFVLLLQSMLAIQTLKRKCCGKIFRTLGDQLTPLGPLSVTLIAAGI